MTKLAWCTDVHLDFLGENINSIIKFGESLIEDNPDTILITGDISISKHLVYHLSILERVVQRPIYFVLGNHDYYGSSVAGVRKEMSGLGNVSQYLKYLPSTPYVNLSPTTALIGHDGWYDAGYGNAKKSKFVMNDWFKIHEFVDKNVIDRALMYGYASAGAPNYPQIIEISKKLALEATIHVMNSIKAALRYHKVIIIATHFPPFEEAHFHNGEKASVEHLPWYTNKMMGDMLRQAAKAYPNIHFEVFAGHTHGKIDVKIDNNLFCHVGGANYNNPTLQNVIEVP